MLWFQRFKIKNILAFCTQNQREGSVFKGENLISKHNPVFPSNQVNFLEGGKKYQESLRTCHEEPWYILLYEMLAFPLFYLSKIIFSNGMKVTWHISSPLLLPPPLDTMHLEPSLETDLLLDCSDTSLQSLMAPTS